MVTLYGVDIRTLPSDTNSLLCFIDDADKMKIEKIKHEHAKRQSIAARLLLYAVLKKKGNESLALSYNEYGKPFLKEGPEFNISHSENLVLLCIAKQQVGVDIQFHERHDYVRLSETAFHPNEQQILAGSQHKKETFYRIWALKESVMKAEGKGFRLGIKHFYLAFDEQKITVHGEVKEQYNLALLEDIADYTAAVCSTEEICTDIHWKTFEQLTHTSKV